MAASLSVSPLSRTFTHTLHITHTHSLFVPTESVAIAIAASSTAPTLSIRSPSVVRNTSTATNVTFHSVDFKLNIIAVKELDVNGKQVAYVDLTTLSFTYTSASYVFQPSYILIYLL